MSLPVFNPILSFQLGYCHYQCQSFSNGSLAFGYTHLSSILRKFINPQNQIISVGSGLGYLEKLLEHQFEVRFILVDPDPLFEMKRLIPDIKEKDLLTNKDFIKFYRNPDFTLVKTLMQKHTNIKENCDLMLIWPNPDVSSYDFKAIKKLKPNSIFILYGDDYPKGGCAGGFFLHLFISEILGQTNWFLLNKLSILDFSYDEIVLLSTRYKIVYQCQSNLTNGIQTNKIKILWLNLLPYRPIEKLSHHNENVYSPYSYTVNKDSSIDWHLIK